MSRGETLPVLLGKERVWETRRSSQNRYIGTQMVQGHWLRGNSLFQICACELYSPCARNAVYKGGLLQEQLIQLTIRCRELPTGWLSSLVTVATQAKMHFTALQPIL